MRVNEWCFDEDLLLLTHVRTDYEIDLETCLTSAKILDWIMQIAAKTWVTRSTVGDLVEWFRLLMHPHGTVCSMGVECGPIKDVRAAIQANKKIQGLVEGIIHERETK